MSGPCVLDASAAIRLVKDGEETAAVRSAVASASLVAAPVLFKAEVANALWRYTQAGEMTAAQANTALAKLLALVQVWHDLTPEQASRALAAAVEHQHPVYDTVYAVTALDISATLITVDRRLAAVAEKLGLKPEPKPDAANPPGHRPSILASRSAKAFSTRSV